MLDIGTRSEELTVGVWFRFYKVGSQLSVLSMGHKQWPSQCCYPIDVQIGWRSLYRIVYTCLALRFGWNADLDFIHHYFNMKRLGRAPPDGKDIATSAASSCCSISSSLQFVPGTQFGMNEASQLRSAGGSHPGLSLRIDSPEHDLTLRRRE